DARVAGAPRPAPQRRGQPSRGVVVGPALAVDDVDTLDELDDVGPARVAGGGPGDLLPHGQGLGPETPGPLRAPGALGHPDGPPPSAAAPWPRGRPVGGAAARWCHRRRTAPAWAPSPRRWRPGWPGGCRRPRASPCPRPRTARSRRR